jgi:acetoacetyl-CoA reductase/3-oxoacyl-[acyl-carrier protein] reductase
VAAKAGLIGLTKALAKELAPAIRANCVAVGVVQTAEVMTRMNLHQPERLRHVIAEVPMGRIGTPEDVAQAVLYLASADSSYVTGQVLAVGGGRWMG